MSRSRDRRAHRTPRSTRRLEPSDLSQGASHRGARLQHILGGELQSLLRDEAADPILWSIRILDVTVSPDGGHARLAYAVSGAAPQAVARALERAGPFLRARLCEQLSLRRTPKLTFTFVGSDVTAPSGGDL